MTDWYTASGNPTQGSAGASNVLRSEYNSIAAAFSKMPALTGYGGLLVGVNSSGTALQTYSYSEVLSALNAAALNTNVSFLTINGTTITSSTQFSGPGTGLTGTAAGLSIGGNAATATNATNAATATTANALNTANNYQVTNFTYTGTLTGSTGVMNIGSGQIYKDASGNVGVGTSSPTNKFNISNSGATGFEVDPVTGTNGGVNLISYNRLTSVYKSLSLNAFDIRLYGGGASESARIDSTGAVLINQTTTDTGAKLSVTGGIKGTITSGTAVATTSGTAIDFTGIPSWVKRITVMLNRVSTNGASIVQLQIGAGSVDTTGYAGAIAQDSGAGYYTNSFTTGFPMVSSSAASSTNLLTGRIEFSIISGNIWVASGAISSSNYLVGISAGSKSLSGTLDRIRLTTVNGTDAFNAGSINILYEG